jgi:hypothetical protein
MNQSITTIISKDIILLYKCTDEYRANIQMVKKGDNLLLFPFLKLIQINNILSDNVHKLYIYIYTVTIGV